MIIKLSGLAAEMIHTESIEYSGSKDVKTLVQYLYSKSEVYSNIKLFVSINEELANEKQIFTEEDFVLVFTPFSGG